MLELYSVIVDYFIPFLVVLTGIVFVHELGHYLAAISCGVRVEVFSVGFGPELFGRTDRKGTRWRFSAIPFGGYVKMYGEMQTIEGEFDREQSEDGPGAGTFHSKPLGSRAFVVAAGPVANFLLAIIIFAGLYMALGQALTPATVGTVQPSSAAERAGFQAGDRILTTNGTRIESFEQFARIIQLHPGLPLEVSVLRDDHEVGLSAVPDIVDLKDRFGNPQRLGRLGIVAGEGPRQRMRLDPPEAIWSAVRETFLITGSIFTVIGQVITGTRGTNELGGPIRIAQMSGDMWSIGLASVLTFSAILSINLGMINLFPIPILDGGHLMLYFIEALRGRPLGLRAQLLGWRIGFAMVAALMVLVVWNDIVHMLRLIEILPG